MGDSLLLKYVQVNIGNLIAAGRNYIWSDELEATYEIMLEDVEYFIVGVSLLVEGPFKGTLDGEAELSNVGDREGTYSKPTNGSKWKKAMD